MKTLILFILIAPSMSFATLGQDRSSVATDISNLGAEGLAVKNTHSTIFHVDAIDFHGMTIKEYSDMTGTVFAISWKGARHPDLKDLIGNFSDEFKKVDDGVHKGHRHHNRKIVTSQITVTRGGHLGEMQGSAYLNDRIPAGFSTEDMK